MKILDKSFNKLQYVCDCSFVTKNGPDKFTYKVLVPFYGQVWWDKISLPKGWDGFSTIRYIDFLAGFVDALYDFFVNVDVSLEKSFIACISTMAEYYTCYLVKNIEDDYIYVFMSACEFFAKNSNGVIDGTLGKPYVGHLEIMEFIYDEQSKIYNDPSMAKSASNCYFRSTPAELLDEFIPCFEENITDIPADSILWKTPYLIETMKKFQALKEYRKTLG